MVIYLKIFFVRFDFYPFFLQLTDKFLVFSKNFTEFFSNFNAPTANSLEIG